MCASLNLFSRVQVLFVCSDRPSIIIQKEQLSITLLIMHQHLKSHYHRALSLVYVSRNCTVDLTLWEPFPPTLNTTKPMV